ncbi:MAG: hypothetical protein M1827_007280 [Pycnora praestabilis]|nr:MAG: hypothetical protein M1827_007280 [Pycnora praestabilis]
MATTQFPYQIQDANATYNYKMGLTDNSFAAKARAAELSAARQRQISRELEEGDIPAQNTISLGALTTFKRKSRTRTRKRGQSWKALNPTYVDDVVNGTESAVDDSDIDEALPREIRQGFHHMPVVSPVAESHSARGQLSDPHELAWDASFSDDEWDPDLSPGSVAKNEAHHSQTVWDPPAASQFTPPGPPYESQQSELEARLASLGVLPPIHPYNSYQQQYGYSGKTYDTYGPSISNAIINHDNTGSLPSQFEGRGTMDFNYRFPSSQQYQRYQSPPQPMVTTSHAAGKRDMLLKSLQDIAESSKERGISRTVLYDPVTTTKPREGPQVERLGTSEPLPWKERPVDIHTEVVPVDTDPVKYGRRVRSSDQLPEGTFDQSQSHLSRIRNAENWWNADNRKNDGNVWRLLRASIEPHPKVAVPEGRLLARRQYGSSETPPPQKVPHSDINEPQFKASPPKFKREQTTTYKQQLTALNEILSQEPSHQAKSDMTDCRDVSEPLLKHLLSSLHSYKSGPPEAQRRNFASWARVPEWCIDKSPAGTHSFFGEDWGAPPPRVGRDPRYRPLMHEPRYTVYEDAERTTTGEAHGWRFR